MDGWMDGCPCILHAYTLARTHKHTEHYIFPSNGFLGLMATLSVDGMNCAQEKGTEVLVQKTGLCS